MKYPRIQSEQEHTHETQGVYMWVIQKAYKKDAKGPLPTHPPTTQEHLPFPFPSSAPSQTKNVMQWFLCLITSFFYNAVTQLLAKLFWGKVTSKLITFLK